MKKILFDLCMLLLLLLIHLFFFRVITVDYDASYGLNLQVESELSIAMQTFYSDTEQFIESQSQSKEYTASEKQDLDFNFPASVKYLRVDLGENAGKIQIHKMMLFYEKERKSLLEEFRDVCISENMIEVQQGDNGLIIESMGNDPFFVLDVRKMNFDEIVRTHMAAESFKRKISFCAALDVGVFFVFLFRRRISKKIRAMIENRGLVVDLAKNDFKTKYAGSYLGIIWALIQPIVTILVYWFVFQVGFRSGSTEGVPFVLWLTAGLVPWFFFNEALNSATVSLLDYGYLVKKVVFDVEIVPLIRILSALFVHVFFVAFMTVMFMINGILPSLEWMQLIYYSICLIALVIGIVYATSALVVFFRDLSQIIIVILQVAMWMTPIMWNLDIIPEKWRFIFLLNPLCYIVQGYRSALISRKWFWDNTYQTIAFWVFVIGVLVLGSRIFSKLKIHFADVI